MIEGYCRHFRLKIGVDQLRAEALEWATTRGSRSGRVAWQFVQDLAGRLGRRID
jgi:predicted AAA+ superfamily ATPase